MEKTKTLSTPTPSSLSHRSPAPLTLDAPSSCPPPLLPISDARRRPLTRPPRSAPPNLVGLSPTSIPLVCVCAASRAYSRY
jgi:hypothetical protein